MTPVSSDKTPEITWGKKLTKCSTLLVSDKKNTRRENYIKIDEGFHKPSFSPLDNDRMSWHEVWWHCQTIWDLLLESNRSSNFILYNHCLLETHSFFAFTKCMGVNSIQTKPIVTPKTPMNNELTKVCHNVLMPWPLFCLTGGRCWLLCCGEETQTIVSPGSPGERTGAEAAQCTMGNCERPGGHSD